MISMKKIKISLAAVALLVTIGTTFAESKSNKTFETCTVNQDGSGGTIDPATCSTGDVTCCYLQPSGQRLVKP
jgi:hypothetical protein